MGKTVRDEIQSFKMILGKENLNTHRAGSVTGL
jgi:hypothetical protein